ncbi:Hypothetical_protein [Hexamita inflata]|uniref:Hypothetical_protein n=1 Tax=Hexamita inflata TaxID=28002 RepID=A0AA86RVW1_9EUKA|nr:Hypothetical protein HINF_LOCUS61195 [Hexamita inflata]
MRQIIIRVFKQLGCIWIPDLILGFLLSFSYISTHIFTYTPFLLDLPPPYLVSEQGGVSIFGGAASPWTSRVARPGKSSRRRLAGPVDPCVVVVCIQEHPNPTLLMINSDDNSN